MTKSTLIILTSKFPFGSGEEFLESEIEHLAHRFDRVVLAPVGSKESSQERPTPDNVIVLAPKTRVRLALEMVKNAVIHGNKLRETAAKAAHANISRGQKWSEMWFHLRNHSRAIDLKRDMKSYIPTRSDNAIIYAYWLHAPASTALYFRNEIGRPDIAVVSRAHGFDLYYERSQNHFLPGRDQLTGQLNAIFPVSRHGAAYVRERYPTPIGTLATRRLGVMPAKNAANATQDPIRIVSCSYVRPVKRLDLLIHTIVEVRRRGFDAHWAHIGPLDGEYAASIHDLAQDLLPPSAFTFVGGLRNQEVRDWLANNPSTLFINLSESEGVPVSIMEAIAQGLPVIATNVGGTSDLWSDDSDQFHGLLPANPTIDEIAGRVESLLSTDTTTFNLYVHASIEEWKAHWNAETNYSDFADELFAFGSTQEDN